MVIKIKVVYLHHQTRTTGRFPGKLESVTMKPESIYNGLDYTTSEINRNYKIKVNGIVNGKRVNMLVGVSGLIKIVGDIDLVNRLLKRAFNCIGDKEVCKLRRGVKITFYYQ